jgi:hypothetical protein
LEIDCIPIQRWQGRRIEKAKGSSVEGRSQEDCQNMDG